MSDTDAIRRTIARYCHSIDDAAVDDWAGVFAPEGTFVLPGLGSVTSRANLAAFATKLTGVLEEFGVAAKHLTTNSAITVDGNSARAVSDFTVLARTDGVWSIMGTGRYADTLVRVDGDWLFAERVADWYGGEAPPALAAAVRPILEAVGTVEG